MILFIRSTIFNLFFFAWTFLVAVAFLPLLLTPPRIAITSGRIWARGIIWAARWLAEIRMEVRGHEYIPSGPAIIAAKHQSAWETAVFYLLLPMPVYVLKKELQAIPLFGWHARAIKTIAVDRKGGAAALRDLVRQADGRLKAGRQIILFPEGTRVKPGERRKYQPGIAALYRHANMPVTPVALNSGLCWPKNSYLKKPGTITIEFLPPLPSGLTREKFMRRLEDSLEKASV